jgi:carbohydrate diacid regulator
MAEYIQQIVNQIKGFIDVEFGFCDLKGNILGCSQESRVGEKEDRINDVVNHEQEVCALDDTVFRKYYKDNHLDFIGFIKSPNQDAINYMNAIGVCIVNLKNLKESHNTKSNFIRSIILEEIEIEDILIKAREMNFVENAARVVLYIRTGLTNKTKVFEVIHSLFPNRNKDFITSYDEQSFALIKEFGHGDDSHIEKIAELIISALEKNLSIVAQVGVSRVFDNITQLLWNFKEAQRALVIGQIFYPEKRIMNYNKLGVGRLINELPSDICMDFIEELFKGKQEDIMDPETIETVKELFRNDLHVSETSRKLFIHRNTLVYRLEKISEVTGLDITKFEDAVVFKMALFVWEYLKKSR